MANYYKNTQFWLVSITTLFGSLGFAGFWTMLAFYVTDYLGQSPLYISIFMVSGVLASMLIAPYLARYSDRGKIEQKRVLYLTSVAGILWVLIFYFSRNYWLIWAVNVSIVAVAGSGWSLIVSYAKMQSFQFGEHAPDAVMFNRAMFSLGWCVGPAIGGVVVSEYGFQTLFLMMLGFSVLTLLFVHLLPPIEIAKKADLSDAELKQSRKLPYDAKILLLAFWLLSTAMASAMVVFSFHIISIGGGEKEAGRAFAIAAFIEIPVLVFGAKLLKLLNHRKLIIIIFVMSFSTYFAMSFTFSIYQVYMVQVFGGVMVALAVGIGMVFIQDTMPESPAVIMAYYSNMLRLATLVGGGLIGFFVEYFSTDDLLVSMSLLPLIGLAIILVGLKPNKSF